jgi:hypothetical protein
MSGLKNWTEGLEEPGCILEDVVGRSMDGARVSDVYIIQPTFMKRRLRARLSERDLFCRHLFGLELYLGSSDLLCFLRTTA